MSEEAAEVFLKELHRETQWQWKWEGRYRRRIMVTNWSVWLVRVLILAISTYQITSIGSSPFSKWAAFSLAALSVMNLGLPLISSTFRYQQRQEVHDRQAREYSVINIKLRTGQIDLATAVASFTEIQKEPVEALIRKTP